MFGLFEDAVSFLVIFQKDIRHQHSKMQSHFCPFFLKWLNPSEFIFIDFFLGDPLINLVLFHLQVHLICYVYAFFGQNLETHD